MMPLWVVLALSVAGGLGAVARFVLDGAITGRIHRTYPIGTTVINVSGSFLLGVVTALAVAHALPPEWRVIIGVGFLGGYTTFSTASFETVRLALLGRWGPALLNGFGMMLAAFLAAAVGMLLGSLL
ncbi:MAG: fluoride efflux transporter CrcB [Microbacterium sp.]|uniref:fluoride efflux transporter CrcB n=1 Tax=Microbacterium sp. TaxID=51671 RepID=UPI0039E52E2F